MPKKITPFPSIKQTLVSWPSSAQILVQTETPINILKITKEGKKNEKEKGCNQRPTHYTEI